jgi:hypothetical protein
MGDTFQSYTVMRILNSHPVTQRKAVVRRKEVLVVVKFKKIDK